MLRFNDPARSNDNGTVWVWGAERRPRAISELYQPADNSGWVYVFHSLATGPLRSEFRGESFWRPDKSDTEFKAFPQQPAVSANEKVRSRQIKALARRFDAHEFWDPDNSRFELRLLPRPLHRYSDDKAGVVDGALFIFANGTNPEVLLLIEARRSKGELEWTWAAARMGHAEMHLKLDGEEVWTRPRVSRPRRDESYWLYYSPIRPADRPKTKAPTP